MVHFKTNKGVSVAMAKHAMQQMNEFVREQPGFVSRRTSVSEDGSFLDIVLWEDLESAKTAAEKANAMEGAGKIFKVIDQKSMTMAHFEIFNSH